MPDTCIVSKFGHSLEVLHNTPLDRFGDFWGAWESGGWEPDTFDVLHEYLTPDVDFLDVGAWIGPITLIAAKLCGAVVAVEPDPVALASLRTNVALNGLSNVLVCDLAVGPKGRLTLGRKERGWLGDSMTSTLFTGDSFVVDSFPLERFVSPRCGLIKVDIEGAEQYALEGFELPCPMWLSTHGFLLEDSTEYDAAIERFTSRYRVVRTADEGRDLLVVP